VRAGAPADDERAALGEDAAQAAGMELAGQFSARFAQMASGVLAGMADALEKSAADKRKNP